jgi:hypothetical protein
MLFPDERIGRHGEERLEVVLAQRPQLDELAGQ